MSTAPYTAIVTSTGDGRAGGRATSTDGTIDLTLTVPKEQGGPGGAPNPEALLAAGWSSCFHSAVKLLAAQRKLPVQDSSVVAEISLHNSDTGFSLSATLRLELGGGIDQATADELAQGAHQICPYSKATRGNIPVTIEATVA